ncbi:MAG: hypothetical protein NVSMB46_02310 [Candidatus Saccharimonadales bacterium]
MKQHRSLLIPRKKSLFLPHYTAKNVGDIDFWYLQKAGYKACLIDLDDTVVLRHSLEVDIPTQQLLKRQPLDVFIASNRSKRQDIRYVAKQMNAKGVIQPQSWHAKPSKAFYRRAIGMTKYKQSEIVMIGDRIFQDIWGANRNGITSIAVSKFIDNRFRAKLRGLIDTAYLRHYKKQYRDIK